MACFIIWLKIQNFSIQTQITAEITVLFLPRSYFFTYTPLGETLQRFFIYQFQYFQICQG